MKVGVIGSMQYTEKMMGICDELRNLGHEAFMSKFAASFVGKDDKERERIKLEQKYQQDAIREDCKWVKNMDALVVANYDKHGISNYIGGNAFIEMAYAFILGKPLYLINPIPDMPYYGTEIIAMKPIVANGDLTKVQ
jgi:hypothetical protein